MGVRIGDGGIFLSEQVWVALVLFYVGSFLWGQSVLGATAWRETRNPVPPALQAGMSPFDRVYNGLTGCLAAVILRAWAIFVWGLGLYVLFRGYDQLVVIFYVLIGVYVP